MSKIYVKINSKKKEKFRLIYLFFPETFRGFDESIKCCYPSETSSFMNRKQQFKKMKRSKHYSNSRSKWQFFWREIGIMCVDV